jgi:Spy/CpxP family protein refolding chaperone
MSNMTKIAGAVALGLGIAVAIPVLGHGGGYGYGMHGPYGGNGGGWGPGHHMGMHDGQMNYGQMHGSVNVEQNLGDLKASLDLTTDQQPVWDQYESAVKNMIETRPMDRPRTGSAEEHFAQMEEHMTHMQAVFKARKTLYETLTDEQKKTLDGYGPGPYGHHFGYRG